MATQKPDGELVLTVPPETQINLRLLAAADSYSWRWGSSSSSKGGGVPTDIPETHEGDVDMWLTAGKSIIVRLEAAKPDQSV